MDRVAVIGAGSWGTTLANHLAKKGFSVVLWVRRPELVARIKDTGQNTDYLPGVVLSTNLRACASLEDSLQGAGLIVCAVPSHGIREVMERAALFIARDVVVVNTSKGIEQGSKLTGSDILGEVLGHGGHGGGGGGGPRVVVLSGPSFAKEVSAGLPCAVSAASLDASAASMAQRIFSTDRFRVYTNTDVVGVELGGALKNVVALASGISDGLALGDNARAALITRGLAEMARLGLCMGARADTFSGLSGMGDLVLTATGDLSRNRTVGMAIGKGATLEEVLEPMKMVAEGVKTVRAVTALARAFGVEMPIARAVEDVLYNAKAPMDAVLELMTRDLKGE